MEPNYKAFAIELMDGFPDDFGDVDGFDLQELAAKHGLLLIEQRTVPCGERCQCLESFNDGEVATCYRINWR